MLYTAGNLTCSGSARCTCGESLWAGKLVGIECWGCISRAGRVKHTQRAYKYVACESESMQVYTVKWLYISSRQVDEARVWLCLFVCLSVCLFVCLQTVCIKIKIKIKINNK